MKLILILLLSVFQLQAQIVTIPDVNFKNKLLNHNPVIDTNSNGEIEVAEAEAVGFPLNVSGAIPPIVDLTGIEAFTHLEQLNCAGNQIETLDLSSNTLLWNLDCGYNAINDINLSQNVFLKNYSGSGNPYTSLDVSANYDLEFLQSNFGNLTAIDVSKNINLKYLYLQGNFLTTLDITQNPNLEGVILDDNNLTSLDFSQNPGIYRIYARNNLFETLDVSNNPLLATLDLKWNDELTYLNLKSGNNTNLNISGVGQTCNFEELPILETVCLDDVNSPLASFIEAQAGHPITFTENCPLSIEDITKNQVVFYPNPVKKFLSIQSQNPISEIEIHTISRKKVLYLKESNLTFQVDMSKFSTGLYLVTTKTTTGISQTYKILKL
ncbi:MAG: T9SS type A sorting domain-containing protein [Flavobacteriaceae bacterium]